MSVRPCQKMYNGGIFPHQEAEFFNIDNRVTTSQFVEFWKERAKAYQVSKNKTVHPLIELCILDRILSNQIYFEKIDFIGPIVQCNKNVLEFGDDSSKTILYRTVKEGAKIEVIYTLLKWGADPNVYGDDQSTILWHVMEKTDNVAVGVLLLKYGAIAYPTLSDHGRTNLNQADSILKKELEPHTLPLKGVGLPDSLIDTIILEYLDKRSLYKILETSFEGAQI